MLAQSPEPNYTLDTGALRNSIENSGKFYLTRTEQQFDNPVNKFVDRIFSPEVVHLGKVPVACTVVTAIKRKNPLCLLNPYFFQAFW
ncbi:MAG TPA: hypothetical protein VL793_04360 [Patescibacteria group bacterium]|nr:hypothetical protein [Patescibacteria group bacterium]